MKLVQILCMLPLLIAAKGSSKSGDKGSKQLAIGIPKDVTSGGKGKTKANLEPTSCAYGSPVVGCLEVMDGKVQTGNLLILGDCSNPDNGFSGENKSPGRVRSSSDTSMCMDVGDTVTNNAKLTVMPCNKNKTSQYFSWSGSRLHPVADTSLCVTYRGFTADVGEDLIILKPCATVVKQEGKGAPKDWCLA